jgi:hypothetical protein
MKCDCCKRDFSEVVEVHKIAQFRGVRQTCWGCHYAIYTIHDKWVGAVWKRGGKDWYQWLVRSVRGELKRLYRRAA